MSTPTTVVERPAESQRGRATGPETAMRLSEIHRYPVKSLQGEHLDIGEVHLDGLRGDRCWGIRDDRTGRILTARRAPELLNAMSTLDGQGRPVVRLPNETRQHAPGATLDDALGGWLGRPVTLVNAREMGAARAEYFADATDDTSTAIEWSMPSGRFVDAAPLLVVTTATLRAAAALYPSGDWRWRRFRPNLVVDLPGEQWPEDGWCDGRILTIGDVEIIPRQACIRCTMVTRPQPGLGHDPDIFRTLARHHGGTMGVWADVRRPGILRIGDEVRLTSPSDA